MLCLNIMIASFIEILSSLWKDFGQSIKESLIQENLQNENTSKISSVDKKNMEFFNMNLKSQKKQIVENKIKIWKKKRIIKNKIKKNFKMNIVKKQGNK